MAQIREYPWRELPHFDKHALARLRALSQTAESLFDMSRLNVCLHELLKSDVELQLGEHSLGALPGTDAMSCIRLQDAAGTTQIVIEAEADLVSRAVALALDEPSRIPRPELPLSPVLSGAFAAVCLELVRRSCDRKVFKIEPCMTRARSVPVEAKAQPPALRVALHVSLAGRLYGAQVWFASAEAPRPLHSRLLLRRLGRLELSPPLVVGVVRVLTSELARLRVADVLLCGTSLWLDANLLGRAALAAPCSECGPLLYVRAEHVVLGDGLISLATAEAPARALGRAGSTMSDQDLTQTLVDLPLTVRLELGCVTMSAADFAALIPGDVVSTNIAQGTPITLRVGGEAVAQGELVLISGELGVRINELLLGSRALSA